MTNLKSAKSVCWWRRRSCLALSRRRARAQSLRPNILVVFDTSGSMLRNDRQRRLAAVRQQRDGQTSRIYQPQEGAARRAGAGRHRRGQLRPHALPADRGPQPTPVCPRGHYRHRHAAAAAGMSTGYRRRTTPRRPRWRTARGSTRAVAAGAGGSRHQARRPASSRWRRATSIRPTATSATVYKWIDGTEATRGTRRITDPELRSPRNAYTPIGRSLFYARMYFDNYVKPRREPLDPKGSCRPNLVIFVTDGAETCDTTKPGTRRRQPDDLRADRHLRDLPPRGAGLPAASVTVERPDLRPHRQRHRHRRRSHRQPHRRRGRHRTSAILVTLTDTTAVKPALVGIIATTVPPAEICNGKDDNCNGLIDEGVSNICPVANPNSPNDPDNQPGTAAKHCAVETCNCKDDNCNGQVDEGLPPRTPAASRAAAPCPPRSATASTTTATATSTRASTWAPPATNDGVGRLPARRHPGCATPPAPAPSATRPS